MKTLSKHYSSKDIEDKWYSFWESNDFFHANPFSKKPPYSIILPPPNVTGVLHMGHALVNTLQDILIRFKRMCGHEAVWIPGVDHAGISTQTIVERSLMAKTGKRRKDFSREEFLSHIWKWKEENESKILIQLKKLGCSCDWKRKRFTMDKEASHAVRCLFKKLFDQGLIYQGDYLVNWDPVTQTALADDEVEYEEREGFLWSINYPLANKEGYLTVATTRPETMLGDVALAVSPKDSRYKHFIGEEVLLPIVNRKIPVIADAYVNKDFGTGVVKITPAHDPNDYEMGQRHSLPLINLLNPDGTFNKNGLEFQGKRVEEVRTEIIKKLKMLGFLTKIEPHKNRVGVSYRSKATIEPYLSKQWFIKMQPFKEKLIDAIKSKHIHLHPKSWEKTYFHWIENLRDWCISRQLWWGHRIPIWTHKTDPKKVICFEGEGLPPEVQKEPDNWKQDEDVLDTWFSSALWPFSTLGWPKSTSELKTFYPTSTLLTGHDILFFWVARMIMMGEYVMGEPPFKHIALQGLIYGKSYWREAENGGIHYVDRKEKQAFDLGASLPKDVFSKWEKMSKSKGNVVDPLEIINTYGADAMRIALASSATQSAQIDLDVRRFEEFKHFINKIWNGSRFALINLSITSKDLQDGLDLTLLTLEDHWIFSRLNNVITRVRDHLENFCFDKAALDSYSFFWDELCAFYVEIIKPVLFGKQGSKKEQVNKQKVLLVTLVAALRLMHPMIPFITEEIFQLLKTHFTGLTLLDNGNEYLQEAISALLSPACTVAPFPKSMSSNKEKDLQIEKDFKKVQEVIYTIRNIRAEMGLAPNITTELFIEGDSPLIVNNEHLLRSLVNLSSVHVNSQSTPQGFFSAAQVQCLKLIIPLPLELQEKEAARLSKEKEKIENQIQKVTNQLSNDQFVKKAPKELVEKTVRHLEELKSKVHLINKQMRILNINTEKN